MHSGRFIIVQKHFVIITEVPPSLYRSADFPRGETFRTNEPDQYPLSVTHFPYETHNECEASNFSMARPKLRSSFRANARPPVLFRRRPLCQNSGENLIPCMMSFQAMPRHQDVCTFSDLFHHRPYRSIPESNLSKKISLKSEGNR
jgi:hypothetical protein